MRNMHGKQNDRNESWQFNRKVNKKDTKMHVFSIILHFSLFLQCISISLNFLLFLFNTVLDKM